VAWVNQADQPRKWSLPVGIGVQFVDLLPEDAELLRTFAEKSNSPQAA
jgi:hypothetical protein